MTMPPVLLPAFSSAGSTNPNDLVNQILTSTGSDDIFIVKYDRALRLLAVFRAGGASSDMANSIAANPTGEMRLTGTFQGVIQFPLSRGLITLTSQGLDDIFVARYSSPKSGGPQRPTNVVARAISSTKIEVTWADNSDNEGKFSLTRDDLTNPSNPRVTFSFSPDVTMFLDEPVQPETRYQYQVQAINDDTGDFSDREETHTLASPSDCRATSVTSNSVAIAWVNHSQLATGFKIARSTQTSDASFRLIDSTGRVEHYNDNGAMPNTRYYYRIWAYARDSNAESVSNYCSFSALTAPLCQNVVVQRDWNLISVPVLAASMSKTSLFPTATTDASGFNGSYVPAATLQNGKGYWLKFAATQSVSICGSLAGSNAIPVSAGWNIIGPHDRNAAVSQMTSTPAGIISTSFFGYISGYQTATILESGKGYWVKVSQNGQLNLPSGGAAEKVIATTPDAGELKSAWGKIIIADRAGRTARLYVTDEEINLDRYELPPTPPAGLFDVRYGSNRHVEHLAAASREIRINAAEFPITLRAEGMAFRFKGKVNGELLDEILQSGSEMAVNEKLATIKVELANAAEKPLVYELQQNYPNPFNPTTVIKFSLPEAGRVRLALYNLLGNKVADLIDEHRQAGFYQMEFNAKDYPSGVYFYKLESGRFTDLKKMIILR
jgi:hypothetical protein